MGNPPGAGLESLRPGEAANAALRKMLADYAAMLRIRLAEEAVLALRLGGTIVGSVHLSNGQEAIPVGVVRAREPQDPVFATYRGHGWALACGLPVETLLAELAGRATGVNGGRGGSAYLTAPDHGFYGENSIVGGGVPVAVGAALAARFDGSGRVAISVFGDGALNQGAVHEALNFASVFSLPVVFVCENNRWSELTPIAAMVKDPVLSNRAIAYAMPGVRIDGNDPALVHDAAAEAFARARRGDGPTLIEAMTQRIVGHYVGDAEAYRAPGELDAAREDEPLARIRRRLLASGLTDEQIADLERPVRQEVERAVEAAVAAPPADTSRVLEYLYA